MCYSRPETVALQFRISLYRLQKPIETLLILQLVEDVLTFHKKARIKLMPRCHEIEITELLTSYYFVFNLMVKFKLNV